MQPSTPPSALDSPRVKILTVGNAGVGKSCLIKRYCEGRFVAKYIPTIGIDYGVKRVDIQPGLVQRYRAASSTSGGTSSSAQSHSNGASSATPPATVRVNFWDVAGGAESFEIRNEFYGAAQGVVFVYDVRNADSFAALNDWWDELGSYTTLPVDDLASATVKGGGGEANSHRRRSSGTTTTGNTPAGKAVGDLQGRSPLLVVCANKVDDVGDGRRVVTEVQGKQWATAHGCLGYYETSASSDQNVREAMDTLFSAVVARFM